MYMGAVSEKKVFSFRNDADDRGDPSNIYSNSTPFSLSHLIVILIITSPY